MMQMMITKKWVKFELKFDPVRENVRKLMGIIE